MVFNFPEGDTVVADMQNQSYYQLLRQYGRDTVWNEALRFQSRDENGKDKMIGFGHILVRPVDKQENYIKRCVATSGDTVQVRDGVLFVNGKESPLPPMGQYAYGFKIRDHFNLKSLKDNLDITTTDVNEGGDTAVIPLTIERAKQMSKFRNVIAMVRQNKLRGTYGKREGWPIFPNDPRYDWSEDNFGPLWVPKAGATINLTLLNLPLYKRAISLYENNDLQVKDGAIFINGEKTDHYTFKQDYYWMMGDNRHRSQDARFWGFVPFDHVVGKAVMVWLTADPEQGGFPRGIRWKRVFSFVK